MVVGLDWNPANKPRFGHELEFWALWDEFAKLAEPTPAQLSRFTEISISAFETLNAPRVGVDVSATEWARERYAEQKAEESFETWVRRMEGLYVVSLVSPCDGLPRYSNGTVAGYVEPFSFRAQFLRDCETIIGHELLRAAYANKKPKALAEYGDALRQRAAWYASKHGFDLEGLAEPNDPDTIEFHLDVVASAARWCAFWSDRGHPSEAYW